MSAEKKIAAIRALNAAGYTLFPLSGTSKVPQKDFHWRSVKQGEYDETNLPANYGIALGPNDLVIDVDPRNFGSVLPDGRIVPRKEAPDAPRDNPLKRLADAVGVPFDTFVVKTGSGGFHILFKVTVPEGMVIVANLTKQGFFGIDSKHGGGYIVGAGSVHPDTGGVYQIVRKSPAEVMAAPPKLVALVTRPAEDSSSVQGTGAFVDDEQAKTRYTSYLQKKAPLSIQGQGGNANAFVVAARGRDFALSPEVALDLMLTHWDDRCSPPWGESDLRGIVRHAYRYATSPIGNAHPDAGLADFRADPLPPEEPKPVAVENMPAVASDEQHPKLPGATALDSADRKVSDVSSDDVDWAMSASGNVLKNFQNLINYLKANTGTGLTGIFGYNEFSCEVVFNSPAPWHRGRMPIGGTLSDADLKILKAHLAVRHTFERSVSEIEEAVTVVARAKRFHPVREYLEGLQWDGIPRMDFWLRDYLGVDDSAYSRAVARKTLCAAIARVLKPGCEFDCVLILEGDQGVGKSKVCRILGGEWAADFPIDPANKDTIQYMQGKWIIELADFEVAKKTDINALKAFLSRPYDKVRLAYGRLAVEYHRQSIFIGSFNPGPDGTYLKDDTGNRRFWTVKCNPTGPRGKVDFKAFKAVRDQLWAEAYHHMTTKGEELYMETTELEEAAKAEVALRHAEHPWTERIGSWLEALRPRKDFVTAREVFIDALGGIDKQLDTRSTRSIAQALRALGWKPAERRVGIRQIRGYARIGGVPADEVVAEKGIEDDGDLGELV